MRGDTIEPLQLFLTDRLQCAVPPIDWVPKNKENFPGAVGFRYDGFQKYFGVPDDGRILPVTIRIEYKRNPSLHECNAKCLNGKCNGAC